jgi:hypothetical protein
VNGTKSAEGRQNASVPIEPADPDVRVHAAWLAQVSKPADGLRAKETSGGATGVATSSLNPASRSNRYDGSFPHPWHFGRRAGVIITVLIGFIFAMAAAVLILKHSSESLTSLLPHALQSEARAPKLVVQSSRGVSGEPAPLGLELLGTANDAVVIIRGLLPGMELSTGTAVAGDTWQLSGRDLQYAWIAPPEGFVGSADLVVELRLPNAQIADRQTIRVEWTRPAAGLGKAQERGQIARGQETDAVRPIAPGTIQDLNDRGTIAAPLPMSVEPSQGQPSRQESKSAGARGKKTSRRSAKEDSRRATDSLAVGDSAPAVKGFWDWSR